MLLVLLLAPVTAEYLTGYDNTLTNPLALVFGARRERRTLATPTPSR